ncbi:transmembrane protein [Legionella gratiana]|uniref:Protoporphyrinogen IX oxidase n=1 Tax=Legionella gratiana TaxID=45066 RepID=A0A378J9Z0_9GAMM|nr:protoporphyrinogen oxidase HemJ [Legionella gratiana]KTD11133.1 transmembrane protein [Legionella gratiana]STX44425.1 transmembrane protein [Legionella gratiana]
MLYVKAFHIITMVAWFSGLFYLPRLFVYHADTHDAISLNRFKIMEKRLYYGITWPAALLTTLLGLWLISYNPGYYLKESWMHAKLSLVLLLWVYHLLCGHYLKAFAQDQNQKSVRFFRIYNEMPTLLLIGIVILVVVKP